MSRELDSCPTFQIVDISVTLLRCLLDQPRFWEFLKEQVSHRQKHIKSMLRGQAILSLLQKASSIPESNKQRATEMAINQLRVADDGLHPCIRGSVKGPKGSKSGSSEFTRRLRISFFQNHRTSEWACSGYRWLGRWTITLLRLKVPGPQRCIMVRFRLIGPR